MGGVRGRDLTPDRFALTSSYGLATLCTECGLQPARRRGERCGVDHMLAHPLRIGRDHPCFLVVVARRQKNVYSIRFTDKTYAAPDSEPHERNKNGIG